MKMRKMANVFYKPDTPHSPKLEQLISIPLKWKVVCLEHCQSDRKNVLLTIYCISFKEPVNYIFFIFIKSMICSIVAVLFGNFPRGYQGQIRIKSTVSHILARHKATCWDTTYTKTFYNVRNAKNWLDNFLLLIDTVQSIMLNDGSNSDASILCRDWSQPIKSDTIRH